VTYHRTASPLHEHDTPTLPLLVDTSLYTTGATVKNVVLDDIVTAAFCRTPSG